MSADNIIKCKKSYELVDCRETHFSGNYQILEITKDYPNGETCGIYYNKKEAMKSFNALTKDEKQ